ncbi:hypothetical protein KC345_g10091 [Hortaea werneckii]|nr:hypothetical protein KC345_g10091 [Hortaea werneckii]
MAGSLIAAILLAGCSSNTNTAAATSGEAQTAQTQSGGNAAQQDAAAGAGQNRMNRAGMNFGKIKSISGNTITIYTADMPDRQQNGGGTAPAEGNAGAPAEGQGTQGTPPEGGQAPEGGGKGGAQGGGRQGGGMMQNFSEETTDITVGSDTQFVSVTFDNGAQTETALSLSDLKADDVIQYTLKTDTAEAEKITLSTGGFGGGMGGGRGQGQGTPPAGDAAADSPATSK